MSEVICIKDYSEQIQWLMQTHGIVPPKKGDIFHITHTEERDGTTWYKFAEYPDTVIAAMPRPYGYTHWFECIYFGVIDKLQAEIDAALAAPKPKELIKEPNFAKLDIEQTRCALACYKLKLMSLECREEIRQCCDIINLLFTHLQNLTYNA